MTNYSRSVLKSSSLRHLKNLPVKFGFSLKTVPANIDKKLPSQRCSQPFLIAFSTSRTNGPRLLSQAKVRHTRLSEKNRTQRHTRRNRGHFGWGWYHYPRSVPHVHEHPRAGYQNGALCRFGILAGRGSRKTQKAFGTAMRLCVSLSRRRRGPAGLRDLFRFCRNRDLYIRRS